MIQIIDFLKNNNAANVDTEMQEAVNLLDDRINEIKGETRMNNLLAK